MWADILVVLEAVLWIPQLFQLDQAVVGFPVGFPDACPFILAQ